jgi:hypothetical protein
MTNLEPTDPKERDQLIRDARVEPVDQPIPVTSDGYPTSLDVYGRDVVDTGLTSDASVRGMGADLDAMPGDETPITPAGRTAP